MLRRTRIAALALLGVAMGLASAQAAPVANPSIIGSPTVAATFVNTPLGFVIFNEYLTKPTAVITTTGGGVGQADIFAPEGISQPIPGPGLSGFGGIQAPFSLGLAGPGSVELTLSGKVRTTLTTDVLPQEPPFPESFINLGPNTQITGGGFSPIRYVLDWDLMVSFSQEGRQSESRRTARRIECPNTVGIICEDVYDFSTFDNFFMPSPGVPSIIETTMNYTIPLESRTVEVPEPAPSSLLTVALVMIGSLAAQRRRNSRGPAARSMARSTARCSADR